MCDLTPSSTVPLSADRQWLGGTGVPGLSRTVRDEIRLPANCPHGKGKAVTSALANCSPAQQGTGCSPLDAEAWCRAAFLQGCEGKVAHRVPCAFLQDAQPLPSCWGPQRRYGAAQPTESRGDSQLGKAWSRCWLIPRAALSLQRC